MGFFKKRKQSVESVPAKPWQSAKPSDRPTLELSEQIQRTQANVVQHHYVRAQLNDIYEHRYEALIEETIRALKGHEKAVTAHAGHLLGAFNRMSERLRGADLTINFQAKGWFSTPNDSNSYRQMYEGGVTPTGVTLRSNELNPAPRRLAADAGATFGARTKDVQGNLLPQWGGVARTMDVGKTREFKDDAGSGVDILNPFFNPKTKQVFAALNYGRRPHGCVPSSYGFSYFILADHFKTNALYFAGDTFYNGIGKEKIRASAEHMVAYGILGALYGKATNTLKEDLFKSCIMLMDLGDPNPNYEPELLVEAHLFEPLTFSGNLKAMVVLPPRYLHEKLDD